ncbi:ParB N-terminal domain-containing protein [Bradyrhizobium jicamae]|uniref:ParB N-terminal domain-containing protein n=1 Tax=Bradyrhizobium jicamae TaxID=280332 RepID=UPI001BA5F382|nr:ParB N-terminal domain-containing protein [Bradyrhizobium jicamae]MBR0754931.1 ParB N-terminal domain-containing protein [Bradyrhizobium jicamae]
MSKSPKASGWESEDVDTDSLLLDPENPRLADYGLTPRATQEEIVKVLWQNMAVDELALSIAENGFYRHEPLYAAKERGKNFVIEGNRRLAAVKLLRDSNLRSRLQISSLPTISLAARKQLDTLPVIFCKREEVWAYLGFKHINGPQAWESYPKAHYVAWVHNEVGVALEEIARRIGDKHSTVERLYDGLMVLEQGEAAGVFSREDRYREHFSFSHLTTGLGYTGIQGFLGLPKGEKTIGKRRPVPKDHEKQLGEFLTWLYGSRSKSLPPVIQSQNPDLRRLDEVLKNKQAIAALRKGLTLSVSLEISKGDERVFRESMVEAKQNLQKARGTVLTGYDGNEDLLQTAEDLVELSRAIFSDMQQSRSKKSK